RGKGRQQRHVDVQHVRPAHVLAHLPDRLEERQALDVADRAADLDDDHVRVTLAGDAGDPFLDLVGDMGDDLDRAAEVVTTALLGDHGLVDAARGHVGELGQVLVDEARVVPEVEVRLGAVVPGSTLMYGSSFRMETFRPRAFSSRPMLAAVMPFPSEEVTPPVTKT